MISRFMGLLSFIHFNSTLYGQPGHNFATDFYKKSDANIRSHRFKTPYNE